MRSLCARILHLSHPSAKKKKKKGIFLCGHKDACVDRCRTDDSKEVHDVILVESVRFTFRAPTSNSQEVSLLKSKSTMRIIISRIKPFLFYCSLLVLETYSSTTARYILKGGNK